MSSDRLEHLEQFANEINYNRFCDYEDEELEQLTDRVIEFIKDKDLTYTVYTVYCNHDTHELSMTEKKGFFKFTCGEQDYFDKWVKGFQDQGYKMLTSQNDIKAFINTQVLKNITDKSAQDIMRAIIFNPNNSIDWGAAFEETYKNMPELVKI
jgi:hypothetical protein